MQQEEKRVSAAEVVTAKWETLPSLYVNSAQFVITNWDLRLLFGEIVPDADGGLKTEPRASIVMSPQHMKAFLEILNARFAEYEKANGTVTWERALPQKS